MENFSGGENPYRGKKFIKLEDGSEVEAPEGVNDLYEYKEFVAEQEARARENGEGGNTSEDAPQEQEAQEQGEDIDTRAEAIKLASKIENSIDEKVVKHAITTKDYSKIFGALAGVDSIPMKGDQIKIDQDSRKLAETHDKYDAVMAEALEILRNEYFGEKALDAAESDMRAEAIKLASKIENSIDEKLVRDSLESGDFTKIINALAGVDSVPFKGDQIKIEQDGRKLSETHAKYDDLIALAMAILKQEYFSDMDEASRENDEADHAYDGEDEGSPEEMREEWIAQLLTMEGMIWLSQVKGINSISDVKNMSFDEVDGLHAEWTSSKEAENAEKEKNREDALKGLLSIEGQKWLNEAKGFEKLGDVNALPTEELMALHDEWTAHKEALAKETEEETAEGEEAEEEGTSEKKPLIAVDIDRTRDAEAAARDIAEKMLKEDLASGGKVKKFLKGIWKGNMFRGYYIEKNKKQAYDRILKKQGGEESGLGDETWQSRSEATIDRFISEYDEMIHNDAGEWRDALPENHPAAEAAKKAISEFAQGNLDESNFMQEMARVKAMLKDKNGDPKGEIVLDNYLEIARTAKGRFDHEEGIESIMEGFKLINGEARANVRTEAHMNSLDKIMDKYDHGRFSKFVPPELVAGAASIGIWLAQAGTKSALKAVTFGLGGAAVTGVVAGMKEGARVSTDRAQASREMASGLVFDASGKYDKAVNETVYSMTPATQMASELSAAAQSGDRDAILQVLALADARTKMSDTRNIDLICYSDPTKIEDERFALDLARAEARAALKAIDPNTGDALNQIISGVETVLDDGTENAPGIKAKDDAFKKLRRKQMVKQGLKTAAVAAGTMIVTQEVVAAFSPNSYGIADEVFGLENNADASNTMLAGMLGLKGPDGLIIAGTEKVDAQEAAGVKLTDEEIAQLEQQGYTVNEIESTTLQSQEVNMSASEYAREYGTPVNRDDWGSNGTTAFDGNELSAHYTTNGDGIVTQMGGSSTTWGGESINFQDAVDDGKIRAFISMTGDSQSTPIEVTGQLVNNGSQLEFIPEAGSAAAECFQDGKFVGKYFEVVFDNGLAEDGTQHIIPLATVVGQGVEGTISSTVDVPVTETLYNVIGFERTVEAVQTVGDRVPNPAAMLPFVRRDNLKNARRRAETGTPAPAPTEQTPDNGGGTPTGEIPNPGSTAETPTGDTAPTEPTGEIPNPETTTETEGGETPTGEVPTPEATTEGEGSGAPTGEIPTPAGEQTEETTETEEPAPEQQGEYDEEGEPIWENLADKIGGSRGVWIVNGGLDTAPEDWRNTEYQAWWDDLSEETKNRFAQRSSDRLSPESDTLFDWLQETGKMAGANEIYDDDFYEGTWNDMSEQQQNDIREGKAILNNQDFVAWLRKNDIIPAEGENAAPQGEAA
ncbi:MAG: hypothetical protein ACK5MU_02095 [Candidatus Saccharimonadales bacterium]